MPIKFRCQHCRQFLGISRSKAGEIFDCPTCGWTLRVPELDGTIKPLPDPGLDMGDSKLAQALDELASMEKPVLDASVRSTPEGGAGSGGSGASSAGGTGVEGRVIDDRKDDDDNDEGMKRIVGDPWKSDAKKPDAIPVGGGGIQTMAEPIDLPPLPAPEPIDLEPRFRARKPIRPADPDQPDNVDGDDDSATGARPWRSTAQAGNSWKRLLAAAEFGVTEGDSTDEPVKEAEPVQDSSLVAPGEMPNGDARRGDGDARLIALTGPLIVATLGVGAAVFATGFWVGRITTLSNAVSSAETDTQLSDNDANRAGSGAEDSGGVSAQDENGNRLVAFKGRLTFRTDEGERKADRGARVIVLPVERKGTARLSVTGLHSEDEEEDQQFAATGIRTLGGDVAITNDSGEFEIQLPGSGQYYILAMSNSVSRDESVDASDVEAALSSYFERPSQLLGRVMHHFEEVRYSGDGVTPWDFSFSQP